MWNPELSVWSEVQTCIRHSWCHCHSLYLASVKSWSVLPFWYRLTRVVLNKEPLNGCVCVCVCACVRACVCVKSWENLTKSYRLSTSPVRCCHCTLGNPKKSCSTVLFIHTFDHLRCLTWNQSVILLLTPPENVTTLTFELRNFFIWLEVSCILSNVGGSEKSQLWFVISGSDKNPLWCVAAGMSGKQCHSKCSEWPRCAWMHASSLFWHCSVT